MSKNLKSFLALLVLTFASICGVIYGFLINGSLFILLGIILGIAISAVSWLTRKPGRMPNPQLMITYGAIGILLPTVIRIIFGTRILDLVMLVIFGILLAFCIFLIILTLIFTQKIPSYWKR